MILMKSQISITTILYSINSFYCRILFLAKKKRNSCLRLD